MGNLGEELARHGVHQGNRDSDSDKLTSMFSPFISLPSAEESVQ